MVAEVTTRKWQAPKTAIIALAVAALGAPSLAHAQDSLDDTMCRNGSFVRDGDIQRGRIAGEGRTYLSSDMDGCPEIAECRQLGQPYLVDGDEVLVSKIRLDFACVYFINDGGGSAGYVPIERLQLIASDPSPADTLWIGTWDDGSSADITIAPRDGRLVATGNAFWPGREPNAMYSTRSGQLDGRVTVFGHRGRYDDGECSVDFTLLGDALVAHDNMRCGGMNVSFRGVYTRQ